MQFLITFLMLYFSLISTVKANSIQQIIDETTTTSPELKSGRNYWVQVSEASNFSFSQKGIQIEAGRHWHYFGTDLRFAYSKASYGSISAQTDSIQSYNTLSSYDSTGIGERARSRAVDDSWTTFTVEPGLSIESKLFPQAIPLLTEKARVGLGLGTFRDQTNQILFSAYLFNVEAAFIYQLGIRSPWSVSVSFDWNSGTLVSRADGYPNQTDRELPVNWLACAFGLLYSF